MAVEDLQNRPPISYKDLVLALKQYEETIEYTARKCDRQSTFIAQLADYVTAYPVIDDAQRNFILDTCRKFFNNETALVRRRVEELRKVST